MGRVPTRLGIWEKVWNFCLSLSRLGNVCEIAFEVKIIRKYQQVIQNIKSILK
jgi:hypothetical protein